MEWSLQYGTRLIDQDKAGIHNTGPHNTGPHNSGRLRCVTPDHDRALEYAQEYQVKTALLVKRRSTPLEARWRPAVEASTRRAPRKLSHDTNL